MKGKTAKYRMAIDAILNQFKKDIEERKTSIYETFEINPFDVCQKVEKYDPEDFNDFILEMVDEICLDIVDILKENGYKKVFINEDEIVKFKFK